MPVPNGPQPGLQGQGFEHTEVKMNFDKLMEVMNEVSEAGRVEERGEEGREGRGEGRGEEGGRKEGGKAGAEGQRVERREGGREEGRSTRRSTQIHSTSLSCSCVQALHQVCGLLALT